MCVDHVGVQRQLNWHEVLEPKFDCSDCFPIRKKNHGKIIKYWCRNSPQLGRNLPTLWRHFPTLRRNFPIPWQNLFSTIFAVHGLAESMKKRVLYCSGSWDHLFVSQAYGWWATVPKPSQTLFFGNVIFGGPCVKISGPRQKKRHLGFRHLFFVRNTYRGMLRIVSTHLQTACLCFQGFRRSLCRRIVFAGASPSHQCLQNVVHWIYRIYACLTPTRKNEIVRILCNLSDSSGRDAVHSTNFRANDCCIFSRLKWR